MRDDAANGAFCWEGLACQRRCALGACIGPLFPPCLRRGLKSTNIFCFHSAWMVAGCFQIGSPGTSHCVPKFWRYLLAIQNHSTHTGANSLWESLVHHSNNQSVTKSSLSAREGLLLTTDILSILFVNCAENSVQLPINFW